MNKSAIPTDIKNQKYLKVEPDGTLYYQIGRTTLYNVAKRAGAIRKIGRRVLIDKETLDAYLDSQSSDSTVTE